MTSDDAPGTGLRTLAGLLTPLQRKQATLLLVLMLVGGLAELLTIGAVVPFLALLADPNALRLFPALPDMLDALGAETRSQQLLAVTLVFMAAAVAAAALRLLLA